MIGYTATIDLSSALARYRTLPGAIDAHARVAFERMGIEGKREATREAPKLHSTLAASVHYELRGDYKVEIAPGVNYAAYVHQGTGPASGAAPYLPPIEHLLDYVKSRGGVSFRNTKRGSPARAAQHDELRDRAWGLARYIQRHGTKANPFMQRAADTMRVRAPEILQAELGKLADEVNRA